LFFASLLNSAFLVPSSAFALRCDVFNARDFRNLGLQSPLNRHLQRHGRTRTPGARPAQFDLYDATFHAHQLDIAAIGLKQRSDLVNDGFDLLFNRSLSPWADAKRDLPIRPLASALQELYKRQRKSPSCSGGCGSPEGAQECCHG
jgi:hypothetical protein